MSLPEMCLIPIQANITSAGQGVSSQFNDTVIKIGREFNARRNTRFQDKCRETDHHSNTGYPVHIDLMIKR